MTARVRRLVPAPHVVFRDVGDEAVLLDLSSSVYFGLNQTGARIWALIVEGRGVDAIAPAVAREFDVTVERAAIDTAALIDQLLARRLLVER